MRSENQKLKNEILPLCEAHGVELVALEWLQGPGRGVLRVYIDRPGGDPRAPSVPSGLIVDQCARVSRDLGALLDAQDLIDGAYDLEVGSPGPERPLQKRADFDRFKGLSARISTQKPVAGQRSFEGILCGTTTKTTAKTTAGTTAGTLESDGYRVLMVCGSKGEVEIPREQILRARLVEIKPEKPSKKQGKPRLKGKARGQEHKPESFEQETPTTDQKTAETTTTTAPPGQPGQGTSPSEVATPWQ